MRPFVTAIGGALLTAVGAGSRRARHRRRDGRERQG